MNHPGGTYNLDDNNEDTKPIIKLEQWEDSPSVVTKSETCPTESLVAVDNSETVTWEPTPSLDRSSYYECHICLSRFPRLSLLKCHMLVHKGRNTYECFYCLARFARSSDCVRHMRIHSGERPYVCSFCEKGFTDKGNLYKHLRVHSGGNPFSCPLCTARFAKKSQLKAHSFIHTDGRKFVCELCNKRYARKNMLDAHIATHTQDKTYECEVCTATFNRPADRLRHLQTHTSYLGSRFEHASDSGKSSDFHIPHSTKYKVEWGVTIFKSWHTEWKSVNSKDDVKVQKEMEEMTVEELDYCFQFFFSEVRNTRGECYSPHTLKQIAACLQHQIKYKTNIYKSIFRDPEFISTREALDAAMILSAKVPPKRTAPVSYEIKSRLWESGVFGVEKPQQLVDTLIYYLGFHFALRGTQEQRDLLYGPNSQLTLEQVNGKERLKYVEMVSKDYDVGNSLREPKVTYVFQNDEHPGRCVINMYKIYLSHRPEAHGVEGPEAFYLIPLQRPSHNIWYTSKPMGVKMINQIISRITLSLRKDNITSFSGSSLPRTTKKRLMENGTSVELGEFGDQNIGHLSHISKDDVEGEVPTIPLEELNNEENDLICDEDITIPWTDERDVKHSGSSGGKTLFCHICDKSFQTNLNLWKHLREHNDLKPFHCDLCDRRFTKKTLLNNHILTHTGKRPFQCPYCDASFARKADCERHHRTHTGEKPFVCSFCEKGFADKSNLYKHLRRHADDPYPTQVEIPQLNGSPNV